ncbi:uncharacterized protein [Pseudochaenichthys georgianus]|uniref:uncharacterized protein isoform X2 n=1 Tax=Pseudochaenichthys georgianus TaxID=52239 RepID=UPI00146ACD8D|nr:uncharacterized protein LOC117460408 isoform X2 [Pseudochaenichthys georgianus]
MSVFAWLLWILFRGTLGGPVQHATWSEGAGLHWVQTPQHEATNPSFYHLPMFQHALGPLVSPELFRPVLQKSPLPTGLNALLFPQARTHHSVTGTGSRAVQVWCGFDDISVRVDRLHLRTWTDPSLFRLGWCPVSRVSPRFLYFHHRLTDCGGEPQVAGGQLVYGYVLSYTPPQQGYVIRVVPLNFPIYCNYNRFHYSYQVGFRPQVQHTTLMKSIRSKLSYSLTVCDAQGEPVPSGHWFFLGEPVYFVAQAAALFAGERLYVDSCYATSSSDPHSEHRAEIITNYGCMADSRRVGSSSRFLLGGGSVLKFSVDAFLFRELSQVLYLHCSTSVGLTTSSSSKSCSYDQAAGRWEELTAAASVCSCCDSMCGNIHQSNKNTVSSPGLLISQRSEVNPRGKEMSFQAEKTRDWEDPEEKLEEDKDENHKEVQTFPQETEEEGASPKKTEETKAWRTSDVVNRQGDEEEEEEASPRKTETKAWRTSDVVTQEEEDDDDEEEEEASPKKTDETKSWRTSDVVTQRGDEDEEEEEEEGASPKKTNETKAWRTSDVVTQRGDEEEDEEEEEEEGASPKKTETKAWRTSDVVTRQGNEDAEDEDEDVGETEVVMDETDSQLKEVSAEDIMPDQSTPEEFSSTQHASVSGLSRHNISTDASGSSATASSFEIDYDDTNHLGSAEHVSTAALPASELCADGDPKNCSTTVNSAAGGAQSFTPDAAVGATTRSGSLWESDIRDVETVGKHSATGDLAMDAPGSFNISRLEANQSDSLLWSDQSDWIQGQAEDRSEGAYGGDGDDDDNMLHSVQSRESDSEQHAHPAGFSDTTFVHGSLGKPDFDSGAEEDEVLHPSPLTGEEQTQWQEEYFSDATARPHGVSSLSFEDMHEDGLSHSALVSIASALQGSVSSLPADPDWADLEPAPGFYSLGFVEEWPVEELGQELMDDFFPDEMNYQKSSNSGLHNNGHNISLEF